MKTIIFFIILLSAQSVIGALHPDDLTALTALYLALGSPPNFEWNPATASCGQLLCDSSVPPRIISLNVCCGVSGTLPTQLGLMTNLQSFNAGNNQLNGTIPNELASLTQLNTVDLSMNQFSGTIPSMFANMIPLYTYQKPSLSLNQNSLSGTIPSQIVAVASNFFALNFAGNYLQCPIADYSKAQNNDYQSWICSYQCGNLCPSNLNCILSKNSLSLSGATYFCCSPGDIYYQGGCNPPPSAGCKGLNWTLASFPAGSGDQTVSGKCVQSPTTNMVAMTCKNGLWSNIVGNCEKSCPSTTLQGASFPTSLTQRVAGTCLNNASVSIAAGCQNGVWGPVSGSCAVAANMCEGFTVSNGFIPPVLSGLSTGICNLGYSGPISATCTKGKWSTVSGVCNANCNQYITSAGVNFPPTVHNSKIYGVCPTGFSGSISAFCNNGVLGQISGTCLANCATNTTAQATYPAVASGQRSMGKCIPPFKSSAATSRLCTNGVFGQIVNPCH